LISLDSPWASRGATRWFGTVNGILNSFFKENSAKSKLKVF
jgi:hypothetical protein